MYETCELVIRDVEVEDGGAEYDYNTVAVWRKMSDFAILRDKASDGGPGSNFKKFDVREDRVFVKDWVEVCVYQKDGAERLLWRCCWMEMSLVERELCYDLPELLDDLPYNL